MAEILLFPAAMRALAQPPSDEALSISAAADDAGPEDDATGHISFARVARLAGTPSASLDELSEKVELLVARLAPADGSDAGLCVAEIRLLQSVLRDLRAFAADLAFAVQGAGLIEHGAA